MKESLLDHDLCNKACLYHLMVVIITWCLDSIYSIYIKMSKSVAQRFAEFRLRKGKLTVVKKLAEKNRIYKR